MALNEQRSIRRITLSTSRAKHRHESDDFNGLLNGGDGNAPSRRGRRYASRFWLWLLVVLALVFVVIVFSWNVTGATVAVTPKSVPFELRHEFQAFADAEPSVLRFHLLPLLRTGEEMIAAESTRDVEAKASGTIVVYNNYSKRDQRLIKNTRFESHDGRIYRIDRSVVVPGQSERGGTVIPGSVEAVVYADSPGEEYNKGLVDFTIPGFKDDAERFRGFYARSKTEMTGGFDGPVRTASPEALAAARERLTKRLEKELEALAREATPPGFVLYDGAWEFAHEQLPTEERGGNQVAVRVQSALTGFLFERAELARAIAKETVRNYDGASIEVFSPAPLRLENLAPGGGNPPSSISFRLSGTGMIVWLFEADTLIEDLTGKEKQGIASVLAAHPSVTKADIVLRPFWRTKFPDKASKIKVERVLPEGKWQP